MSAAAKEKNTSTTAAADPKTRVWGSPTRMRGSRPARSRSTQRSASAKSLRLRPTRVRSSGLPGQYRDEESGLSYNWNRTYDGGTGRFLQREPMLDDFMMLTAMNRGRKMYPGALAYSYAGDMPMTMVDPDGMEAGPNGPAPDFPFFPPPPPPDQCVNNPSELQQCLNACKAGGAAALRYCGTMPTPQLRVMCLSAVAAGTVSCMGFCWARFVD